MSHPANEKVNESEKEAIEERESVDEEIENGQPTNIEVSTNFLPSAADGEVGSSLSLYFAEKRY